VCQGSAADIVKGAMLQLAQQLEQRGWAGNARLLLQVRLVTVLQFCQFVPSICIWLSFVGMAYLHVIHPPQ
jgi:hypothetical protein